LNEKLGQNTSPFLNGVSPHVFGAQSSGGWCSWPPQPNVARNSADHEHAYALITSRYVTSM
jgi:hypothetical protein